MFPHYIETATFGISCDAHANLKEILTRHKTMVAEYLDKNYDRVSARAVSHDSGPPEAAMLINPLLLLH